MAGAASLGTIGTVKRRSIGEDGSMQGEGWAKRSLLIWAVAMLIVLLILLIAL